MWVELYRRAQVINQQNVWKFFASKAVYRAVLLVGIFNEQLKYTQVFLSLLTDF
jgi:hypothetical protein